MIHILGAPRTGSTLLYQLVVNHFYVNYFDNTGDIHNTDANPVPLFSVYGKTKGRHEPSEASTILSNWWGEMDRPIPEMEQRMIMTLNAAEPIVMKNIWNVYRINEWARMFPGVQFIWIKRSIISSGRSDLRARRHQKCGLNKAFLKFGKDVSQFPEMTQIFEQQREVNKTIEEGLLGKEFITIEYKNLCNRTEIELLRLQHFLKVERRDRKVERLYSNE